MKAFLHIGLAKTGTTTIQKFLTVNRPLLLKNGFLYPFSPGQESSDCSNHMKLSAYAVDAEAKNDIKKIFQLNNITQVLQFREKFTRELEKELDKTKANKVVFSNEHCSLLLTKIEEIELLKNLLKTFFDDIEIIVYLRRQDKYLMSLYSTGIKSGMTREIFIPEENLINLRYDYWNILKKWESVFNKNNITVRVFEEKQLVGADLLQDFAKILGLDINNHFVKPENANPSLDIYCLEFLRRMNKYIPRFIGNDINFNRGNLVQLLENFSSSSSIWIESELINSFMSNFEDSNKLVAEYFLGRLDGQLFLDKDFNKKANLIEEIETEKMYEIFAYLWSQKQNELLQQKKYRVGMRTFRIINFFKKILQIFKKPQSLFWSSR